MNIKEFRTKYPEYNDVNDTDLAESLYSKHYSDMDKNEFMSTFVGQKQAEAPKPQEPIADWAKDYPNAYGALGAAKEVGGPVLEALGMVGGGLVGGTAGLLGGGPVGAGVGGVAGGGIGYAGAKGVERLIDQALTGRSPYSGMIDAASQTVSDIDTGAKMEMGGRLIAPVVGAAAKVPKAIKDLVTYPSRKGVPGFAKAAEIEAGNKILTSLPDSDRAIEIAKNIEEMEGVIARTGAPRLAEAQMGGNTKQAFTEQALAAQNKEFGARVVDTNREAIDAGRSTVRSVIGDTPQPPKFNDEQVGEQARTQLSAMMQNARGVVNDAYASLPPSVKIGAQPLRKKTLGILRDMSKGQERKTVEGMPNTVIANFRRAVSGTNKKVSMDTLKAYREQFTTQANTASQAGNWSVARRMRQFRDSIDEVMDSGEGVPPEYKPAYDKARGLSREFKDTYESGVVGKALGYGDEFGGVNMRSEAIPSAIFGPNAYTPARQFVKAVGKDEAFKVAQQKAQSEIVELTTKGGDVSRTVSNWLQNNRDVMKIYGLQPKDVIDKQTLREAIIGRNGKDATLEQVRNSMNSMKDVLKNVYSKDEIQSLSDLHSLLGAVQRNQRVSAVGNSTTAEKSQPFVQIASNFALLGAIKLKAGFMYQASKNILMNTIKLAGVDKDKGAVLAEQLVADAAYDPRLAKRLMEVARNQKSKAGELELDAHLKELMRMNGIKPVVINARVSGTGAGLTGMAVEENKKEQSWAD